MKRLIVAIFISMTICFALSPGECVADLISWHATNTIPTIGDQIYSLAVSPTAPQILYAGSNKGVYKSVTGGSSWSASGLQQWLVLALAISPSNPQLIYAGTWGSGLYISTDGGVSWNPAGDPNFLVITLTIDKSNPQVIYAGTMDMGVFKSINGGTTWSLVRPGSSFTFFVTIDPADSQHLYVGDWSGVVESVDGGRNWNPVAGGSIGTAFQLMIDPTDTRVVYAASLKGGVFKTIDGGARWSSINNGLPGLATNDLAIDPSNPQLLYLPTPKGAFRSVNGGNNWSAIDYGLDSSSIASIYLIVIAPSDHQTLYALTDSGLLAAVVSPITPGDCISDGVVTISEVRNAMNMMLGLLKPATCVDRDATNSVSLSELQLVVSSFSGP